MSESGINVIPFAQDGQERLEEASASDFDLAEAVRMAEAIVFASA